MRILPALLFLSALLHAFITHSNSVGLRPEDRNDIFMYMNALESLQNRNLEQFQRFLDENRACLDPTMNISLPTYSVEQQAFTMIDTTYLAEAVKMDLPGIVAQLVLCGKRRDYEFQSASPRVELVLTLLKCPFPLWAMMQLHIDKDIRSVIAKQFLKSLLLNDFKATSILPA